MEHLKNWWIDHPELHLIVFAVVIVAIAPPVLLALRWWFAVWGIQ